MEKFEDQMIIEEKYEDEENEEDGEENGYVNEYYDNGAWYEG